MNPSRSRVHEFTRSGDSIGAVRRIGSHGRANRSFHGSRAPSAQELRRQATRRRRWRTDSTVEPHPASAYSDVILMCGYGWGDAAINLRLETWMDDRRNRIVLLHPKPEEITKRSMIVAVRLVGLLGAIDHRSRLAVGGLDGRDREPFVRSGRLITLGQLLGCGSRCDPVISVLRVKKAAKPAEIRPFTCGIVLDPGLGVSSSPKSKSFRKGTP
jgi:hypothetical protein